MESFRKRMQRMFYSCVCQVSNNHQIVPASPPGFNLRSTNYLTFWVGRP